MISIRQIALMFQQVLSELWRHKLRSFLTMFGISWGIISLALITSSGNGFSEGQREVMRQIGDSIVIIWGGRTEMQAGGQRAGRYIQLHRDDVQAIREQCPAVETVAAEVKTWDIPVASDYNSGRFLVLGGDTDYLKIRTLPIESGRDIGRKDVEVATRVCVLGSTVRNQLFQDRRDVLGEQVRINNYPYTVVGLLEEKDQNSSYDGWDNEKVIIPSSSLIRDCPANHGMAAEGRINVLIYKAKSESQWEEAQRQVRRTLGRIHRFNPDDEAALSFWDTVAESVLFDRMFESIGLFLAAIALVTLSLGGVGVMNTMFTTVVERTSEIGLKKAVGAKRSHILCEFFLEGLVLAVLSGSIGVLLALVLASFVNSFPMPAYFSGLPMDAGLVLRLSLILGGVAIAAALPPAWRAARMDPVVAMNYEK
jgi:putative ABC transport system permease protein